jgi:hypothetical protein
MFSIIPKSFPWSPPYLYYVYRVAPGYNDFGLYDTSSIASDIVVQINSSLLTATLYCSVITTQNIQSPPWRYNLVLLNLRSYYLGHSTGNVCHGLTGPPRTFSKQFIHCESENVTGPNLWWPNKHVCTCIYAMRQFRERKLAALPEALRVVMKRK